jgi:integrase
VPPPGSQSPAQSSQAPDLAKVWEAIASMGAALQTLAASFQASPTVPSSGTSSLSPPAPGPKLGGAHANHAPIFSQPIDPKPLVAAVNEFLVYQARLARSDRYLRQLRVVFSSLTKGRRGILVHELTAGAVRAWSESPGWSPGTARRYVADVRGFLEWCRRREWIHSNPAQDVRIQKPRDVRAPKIHTPEEVGRILTTAAAVDLDVCRHLAVRYFAGLRTSEALALSECDLRQVVGLLVVPAAVAKTRRRRVVQICPALKAWLALGGTLRGMRPDSIRRVMRLSGVDCPPNVSRHSWCSYHLALHESAAKTALEAGHAEAILFAHYRALVSRAAALEYFSLRPPQELPAIPNPTESPTRERIQQPAPG